jgi:hypothetical protein
VCFNDWRIDKEHRQGDYSIAPEFPRGDGTLAQWKRDDLEQVLLVAFIRHAAFSPPFNCLIPFQWDMAAPGSSNPDLDFIFARLSSRNPSPHPKLAQLLNTYRQQTHCILHPPIKPQLCNFLKPLTGIGTMRLWHLHPPSNL